MDLRQLHYFLAVANHLSFSKASQALHVSQPTLSKMVKNLEDELGLVLIDRSTRRMQLTDAGTVVQSHAETVFRSLHDLNTALSDVTHMRRGSIKLGLPPVIGASFFPRIIAEFHRLHPQVRIQLVEEGGKMVESSLLTGSIDVGVVVLPVEDDMFKVVPLVERELKLVVHVSHRFSQADEVPLGALQGESFIIFRKGFSLYHHIREACIREGFEPRVDYESSQWDFIGEMVASNLGIAFLPETVCARLPSQETEVVPATKPIIHWNLALIWPKDQYVSHATREFISFVTYWFHARRDT
ncbi:LysR family transcriptional regulator [Alicyclobacillus dauci]|uniref:LysR family transcriptional regulator n=1 Tax=Alicyclobacillus dauci TaxID=1475485 RepID=A0ABY6Z020_9BACL|nr:LysR family transcriptional regulator [Alicyclobacillus dauci]WAH36182.1 LysR family transcriptional regulator [Alicyclobacillus dauci]